MFARSLRRCWKMMPMPAAPSFVVRRRFMATNNANSQQDPFETLGVPRDASVADLKAAFNRRAKETHPDTAVDKSDDAEFVRVRAAFESALRIVQYGADAPPDSPPIAAHRRARASAYTTTSSAKDYVSAAKALSLVAALSAVLSAVILWAHWETKQRTGSIAVVHYRRPDK